jgi:hypothetical protein
MTTHDSESELAGRLGASLTPRVPRITVQHRGEQSSGLFDIGAMYAANVEQIMRRARAVRPAVFELAAPGAQASRGSPVHAWARTPDHQHAIEIDLEAPLFEPVGRARGVGWFGVAVAWLATAGIGLTVATTVPAHTAPRAAPALAVATTTPVVAAPVVAPAVAPAAPSAMPTIAAATQPLASAPEPASAAAPKKLGVTPPPRLRTIATAARPVPVDVAVAAPQAQKVAAAPVSSPATATKAAPATSPPAAGGSSLEDLMRKAVEADAKHH